MYLFAFFKQKTAYVVRISYWSSDVCSADLSSPSELLANRLDVPRRSWSSCCWPCCRCSCTRSGTSAVRRQRDEPEDEGRAHDQPLRGRRHDRPGPAVDDPDHRLVGLVVPVPRRADRQRLVDRPG